MGREAVTIRFPEEVLARAKEVKPADESLNEYVVGLVDRETRRAHALATVEKIDRLARKIAERTGVQPDSTSLIRELREGRGRR